MIRSATADDAEAIQAIYAPFVRGTAVSFEDQPPSVPEMRSRIEGTLKGFPWLVMEMEGQVVGYAYAGPHRVRACYRWSVDVAAYVAEGHRGQGIGRALYARLTDDLRDRGYWNAYAGITLPNAASVALHEGVGFVSVGVYRRVGYKLGAWHDVGWWQLALRLDDEPPALDLTGSQSSF